ncbi:hypothetical protein ACPXCG_17075 [Gordonia sp. DT218]|uniref:hypothetical protein n=1 Tax=unclassified Gordonia (in: high G+C Gram-positive bacteria) TaxID=2657482 RepID=UPI003CF04228
MTATPAYGCLPSWDAAQPAAAAPPVGVDGAAPAVAGTANIATRIPKIPLIIPTRTPSTPV